MIWRELAERALGKSLANVRKHDGRRPDDPASRCRVIVAQSVDEPTQILVDDVIYDGCNTLAILERLLEAALQPAEADT